MQQRHSDRKQYFLEQVRTTEKYVIPYSQEFLPDTGDIRILEIGCGEGGNLLPFIKKGHRTVGIDLNVNKINNARIFLSEEANPHQFDLRLEDIYETDTSALGRFDLIMMRDVIEHIHDQEKFIGFIKPLLKPDGVIFFGFPPWRMPFGGHQQMCRSSFLSKLPYFHLLPMPLYKLVLRTFGEKKGTIEDLVEIKQTGISTQRFERIVRKNGYRFVKKDLFLINPNYEIKFGLNPRKVPPVLKDIPFLRDFYTTCMYALIRKA